MSNDRNRSKPVDDLEKGKRLCQARLWPNLALLSGPVPQLPPSFTWETDRSTGQLLVILFHPFQGLFSFSQRLTASGVSEPQPSTLRGGSTLTSTCLVRVPFSEPPTEQRSHLFSVFQTAQPLVFHSVLAPWTREEVKAKRLAFLRAQSKQLRLPSQASHFHRPLTSTIHPSALSIASDEHARLLLVHTHRLLVHTQTQAAFHPRHVRPHSVHVPQQ